jgi:hypothetical protein
MNGGAAAPSSAVRALQLKYKNVTEESLAHLLKDKDCQVTISGPPDAQEYFKVS